MCNHLFASCFSAWPYIASTIDLADTLSTVHDVSHDLIPRDTTFDSTTIFQLLLWKSQRSISPVAVPQYLAPSSTLSIRADWLLKKGLIPVEYGFLPGLYDHGTYHCLLVSRSTVDPSLFWGGAHFTSKFSIVSNLPCSIFFRQRCIIRTWKRVYSVWTNAETLLRYFWFVINRFYRILPLRL